MSYPTRVLSKREYFELVLELDGLVLRDLFSNLNKFFHRLVLIHRRKDSNNKMEFLLYRRFFFLITQ